MNYTDKVKSKLPDTPTSIFAIMSKMANENKAINLSQGFPDFNCSPELIELVNKYMKKGFNQYAPMQGVLSLRETISEKTEELYSLYYHPDKEITITAGATQALYTIITAFVKEDDEVIVIEPAYDCYVPAIILNKGTPVFISINYPENKIDWDKVKKAISARTRMIIINSPHNPTGSILSSQDMEELQKAIIGTNIIVLSDEVYEHIIFDNYEHQSVARFPHLAERSVIVSSFGKTYHTTGWKLGYCLAPDELTKEIRKVHQFVVYAANTPIQYAMSEIIKKKDLYLSLNNFYQKKRDFFINSLTNTNLKIIPSKGTYFQTVDYSKISELGDFEFAEKLTKEFGIASIPVSAFNHDKKDNHLLRFCFAKSTETLARAAEKLNAI